MKERALLIGGQLRISSRRGEGTRVELTIGPGLVDQTAGEQRPEDLEEWRRVTGPRRESADTSPLSGVTP
jgi:hypothetical protein